MENKVVFGLKNVHISKLTEAESIITYAEPFKLPGAVNLTMDKEGAKTIFRADDSDYFKKALNNGYSGSLEVADVIEKFLTDIFGQYKDANGALFENADDKEARFAMMFEIDGDKRKRRIVYYDCLAERPSLEYSTTEQDDVGVKTAKMDISISPRSTDRQVKAVLEASDENETVFNAFFTQVYEKVNSGSGV